MLILTNGPADIDDVKTMDDHAIRSPSSISKTPPSYLRSVWSFIHTCPGRTSIISTSFIEFLLKNFDFLIAKRPAALEQAIVANIFFVKVQNATADGVVSFAEVYLVVRLAMFSPDLGRIGQLVFNRHRALLTFTEGGVDTG